MVGHGTAEFNSTLVQGKWIWIIWVCSKPSGLNIWYDALERLFFRLFPAFSFANYLLSTGSLPDLNHDPRQKVSIEIENDIDRDGAEYVRYNK